MAGFKSRYSAVGSDCAANCSESLNKLPFLVTKRGKISKNVKNSN